MSIMPDARDGRLFRVGISGNSNVRHVIDDWGPELLRRRQTAGLCGTEVRPANDYDPEGQLCQKCSQVIRKLEREMYQRKNNPPDEVIRSCLTFLLKEQEQPLAKVIPLLPRHLRSSSTAATS